MGDFDASNSDGYGYSGHGIDGSGDDDGMSGFGDLTLPGGQVIPFPDLGGGGGGGAIPGIPPSGPSGPPGLPAPNVQVQSGTPPEWIAGVPNALTIVGAIGILFGAVMLLKK